MPPLLNSLNIVLCNKKCVYFATEFHLIVAYTVFFTFLVVRHPRYKVNLNSEFMNYFLIPTSIQTQTFPYKILFNYY